MEAHKLKGLLLDAAKMGALEALKITGQAPATVSKSRAYKLYGEGQVDNWIRKGIVTQNKDGEKNSTVRIGLLELEAAAKTSNR